MGKESRKQGGERSVNVSFPPGIAQFFCQRLIVDADAQPANASLLQPDGGGNLQRQVLGMQHRAGVIGRWQGEEQAAPATIGVGEDFAAGIEQDGMA